MTNRSPGRVRGPSSWDSEWILRLIIESVVRCVRPSWWRCANWSHRREDILLLITKILEEKWKTEILQEHLLCLECRFGLFSLKLFADQVSGLFGRRPFCILGFFLAFHPLIIHRLYISRAWLLRRQRRRSSSLLHLDFQSAHIFS